MSVIAASWGLEKSSNDVVGVGVGVLQAATSDNVQPLALLAAERFGTTIPMSYESKAKAFQLCAKDESSAVWNFFKAKIGYQRGDSGWHLSTTDAGLRFLGLAACLLSFDPWLAAEMLRQCIEETAEDKRLIPTTQHLKQLLHVLQPRLAHANFLDSIDGWDAWLSNCDIWKGSGYVPPPDAIAKIIQAISLLFRLGETGEKSHLEITLKAIGAAWTIAFLKWCLGNPPSVVTESRVSLLDAPESRVLLIIVRGDRVNHTVPLKVQIVNAIDDVRELICLPSDSLYIDQQGMLQLPSYCRSWHRKRPNFKALAQVLPYACHLVLTEMRIVNGNLETGSGEVSANHSILREQARLLPAGQSLSQYAVGDAGVRFGALLPDASAISIAMQQFLSPDDTDRETKMCLKPLEGRKILDLPPMQALQRALKSECVCKFCRPDTVQRHARCQADSILDILSEAVATVILISLIEPVEPSDGRKDFLVRGDSPHIFEHALRSMTTPILSILKDAAGPPEFKECSIETLLEAALAWLAHKLPEDGSKSWLMSAYNGQVIYPKLFDDIDVSNVGLLKLRCLPGSILWKNEQYSTVIKGNTDMGREPDETDAISVKQHYIPPITSPRNDYSDFKIEWQVRVLEKGLVVSATAPQLDSCPDRNPMNAITTASSSLFVECAHDRMATLPLDVLQSVGLRHASLAFPTRVLQEDWDLAVALTDGNEAARYFAMCARQSCVVRNNSCLLCCIDVCALLQIPFIIC